MIAKLKQLGDACRNCDRGESYQSNSFYRKEKAKELCFCNKIKKGVDPKGWCDKYE